MNKTIFSKYIAIVLAYMMLFSGFMHGNEMLDEAKRSIQVEKNIATKIINIKLNEGLLLNGSIVNQEITSFNTISNEIDTLFQGSKFIDDKDNVTKLLDGIDTSKLNFATHQTLNKLLINYYRDVDLFYSKLQLARMVQVRIKNNITNIYENYCSRTIPQLDVDAISIVPSVNYPGIGKIDYHKAKPGFFFSEDPAATTAGYIGFGTTLGAGLAVYTAIYGVTALKGLFVASMLGKSSLIVASATPVGAVILGVAILVGAGVSWYITDKNNKKREKEAKKKIAKVQKELQEAKNYYEAHRIKNSEYKDMGFTICQSGAFQNRLQDHQQKLNIPKLTLDIQTQIDTFSGVYQKLLDDGKELKTELSNYQNKLIKAHQKQILHNHNVKIKSMENHNTAVVIFNESFQTEDASMFTFYTKNRRNCMALDNHYSSSKDQLFPGLKEVLDGYKDDKNKNEAIFNNLQEWINKRLKEFKKKVDRCYKRRKRNQNKLESGIPPIVVL